MANKVATSLPLAELRALCDELAAQAAEPTLKQIQDAAAARGVRISLMAATSFRDSTFEAYLEGLRRKKEAAELIAEAASAGASQSDAAAALLNQQMLDRLMAGEQFTPDEFSQIILNVSRLRAGDQAGKKLRADLALRDEQIAKLQQSIELARFDAAKAVVEHAREIKLVIADKSLDTQARTERVAKVLWGSKPTDFRPVADKGEKTEA